MTTQTGNAGGRDDGVPDAASPGELTAEGLRETFSNWQIFPRDRSRRAVRGGTEKTGRPRIPPAAGTHRPGLTALAERLCIQDWLNSLNADELAEAYRSAITGDGR